MLEMLKKLFTFVSSFPAFTKLLEKASSTGRLDPVDTLEALSTVSPSFKKCTGSAMQTVNNGGGIPEVVSSLKNIGEIEVMGQKLDTRTMTQDLRKAGGICAVMANLIDGISSKSPKEIIDMGDAFSNVKNWESAVN